MAACYIEPSIQPFTTGVRERVAQAAPPACCDTLAPVLSTLVGRTIQAAAQAVAHLEEIELTKYKQRAQWVQKKERESVWVCRWKVRMV